VKYFMLYDHIGSYIISSYYDTSITVKYVILYFSYMFCIWQSHIWCSHICFIYCTIQYIYNHI